MPVPKWCFQRRLTTTRAVSGWSGRVSQRAKASRRPVCFAPGHGGFTSNGVLPSVSTEGTPGADELTGVQRVAAAVDVGRRRLTAIPDAPESAAPAPLRLIALTLRVRLVRTPS